jgi:hypothetical protein
MPSSQIFGRRVFHARPAQSPSSPSPSKWHMLAAKANNVGLYHEESGRTTKAITCFQLALKSVQSTPSDGEATPVVTFFPVGLSGTETLAFPRSCDEPLLLLPSNPLMNDRTLLTAAIMVNIASLYRRNGTRGKAISFFLLAEHMLKNHNRVPSGSQEAAGQLIEHIENNLEMLK